MTKVQLRYDLSRPLDDAVLSNISRAHTVYGILRVSLVPETNQLLVEYDASRLSPPEVEGVLRQAGLPIAVNV